jgi:hypothetical protein
MSWISDNVGLLSPLWDNAEKIGNLALVFIALLAVFAFFFARGQISAARRREREATAREIYRRYLELAFAYPELAVPGPEANIAEGKYRWFVANLLNSSDEVLESASASVWRKVIMAELRYHVKYLQSKEFLEEDRGWNLYSKELRSLAMTVIKEETARSGLPR